MNELKSNFKITEGNVNFYVGIEIIRNREAKTIFIHQSSYVERILERFNMLDAKIKSTPADLGMSLVSTGDLNTCDNLPYRQAIGCLMFLANVTRPDITFIVNYLSRFISDYNEQHWRAIKNVFRYLKGTADMGICIMEQPRIHVFRDTLTLIMLVILTQDAPPVAIYLC